MQKIKAAFFDRDGTLIKDVNYLSNIKKVEIFSEVISLCSYLQNAGYKLFVITNQSGVARGYFGEDFVNKTHKYIQDLFGEKGVNFEAFYYCPHHPHKAKESRYLRSCFCRKPMPGMFFKAEKDFGIDLKKSLMFGDKLSDIQSGIIAGCKSFFIQDFLSGNLDEKRLENLINL